MKKYAAVFGTRPEAIKMAPIFRAFEKRGVPLSKISTGQHLSMLWQALEFFEIEADHDLGAMREGQTLTELLSRILHDVGAVLRTERPDVVLVQGDTSTALAGGMAAYFSGIEVAHVEAGLRTFDPWNPFPEEANRELLARVTRWHFAPTTRARENLLREGIDPLRIHVTGNTIVDALDWACGRLGTSAGRDAARRELAARLGLPPGALDRFVLVTSHRRENFGNGLLGICRAITALEATYPDLSIIWPVHLNPTVRDQVQDLLFDAGPRVLRLEPLDYEGMLLLLSACTFILTDSGGIQEEAAFFNKPVLIMRDMTERPEIVECGLGELVGTDPVRIASSAARLLNGSPPKISGDLNPFGDGRAADRIVEVLLQ